MDKRFVLLHNINMIFFRIFSLFAFSIFISQTVFAQSQERLDRLTLMFEGTITSAYYISVCMPEKSNQYKQFKKNSDQIIIFFAKELKALHPQLSAQMIQQLVHKKQSDMMAALKDFYLKNNCSSPQAVSASKTLQTINGMNDQEMASFLSDIENR